MDNLPHSSLYDQPTNRTAIVLSALVHGALIAALFFGVQWKNEQSAGQPVDVYFGSPAASVPPALPPEPEVKPKTPPPPEPKAVEKPQIDPQIAFKDKDRREKEEKERLKKLKLEEEKKQKEKEEKSRKEEEEKKKREKKESDDRRVSEITKQLENDLKRSKQQQADAARAAREAAINAELGGLPKGSTTGSTSGTQASGGGGSRGKDEYINAIRLKIRGNAVLPPGIQGNPEAIFEVTQLPSGELINVKLSKSTGNKALDEAIERAIKKSDPLPLPKKADLFDRTLKLKYKPFDE